MRAKTCVITGASGGIGLATARALRERGFDVWIVGRDPDKLARVEAELGAVAFRADFSSLDEVRALADALLARGRAIDVLINNAGVWHQRFTRSRDGFEDTFAVNHLAPYLLTRLLLPRLRQSDEPRVVHVSSRLHHQAGQTSSLRGRAVHLVNVLGVPLRAVPAAFEEDRLDRVEGYRGLEAYARSKLAQIVFSNELARREPRVASNALHPGSVATDVTRDSAVLSLLIKLGGFVIKTPEQGARTSVHLASEPALRGVSGRYFANCREAEPARVVHDRALAERLWALSADRVGLPA
ncbi:MAG: SDR family NAD(P)-dependent oxidoreductase [Sandaracinaceae bacterium]|nr:SDR family NAD(P)-dependent oxidoreductase [Sandaracinaceae bacterium]